MAIEESQISALLLHPPMDSYFKSSEVPASSDIDQEFPLHQKNNDTNQEVEDEGAFSIKGTNETASSYIERTFSDVSVDNENMIENNNQSGNKNQNKYVEIDYLHFDELRENERFYPLNFVNRKEKKFDPPKNKYFYALLGILLMAFIVTFEKTKMIPMKDMPDPLPPSLDAKTVMKFSMLEGRRKIAKKVVDDAKRVAKPYGTVELTFMTPFEDLEGKGELVKEKYSVAIRSETKNKKWWILESDKGRLYDQMAQKAMQEKRFKEMVEDNLVLFQELKKDGETALDVTRRVGVWIPIYGSIVTPDNSKVTDLSGNIIEPLKEKPTLPSSVIYEYTQGILDLPVKDMSDSERIYLCRHVVRAVLNLHEKGILSNNLVFKNLLVTDHGEVRIVLDKMSVLGYEIDEDDFFNDCKNDIQSIGQVIETLIGDKDVADFQRWKSFKNACFDAANDKDGKRSLNQIAGEYKDILVL